MKIYLAAPLFTSAERAWNLRLKELLHGDGVYVWLPQDNEPRELTASAIFAMDVQGINQADIVVAIMDGPDPDSGTSWEYGYAYAKGKPVICIRTDFRGSGEGSLAPYNIILAESARLRYELPMASVEYVAEVVWNVLTVPVLYSEPVLYRGLRAARCDQRITHAPGECEYCDHFPDRQQLHIMWGIAFTGHAPTKEQSIRCPAEQARDLSVIEKWGGNRVARRSGGTEYP